MHYIIFWQMKEYFTLKEFLKSNTAKAHNIDNTPTFAIVANLQRLSKFILTPTRYRYGKPIIVTSGYRCPDLNTLVGGVKNSQHLNGCAADLVCADMRTLFNLLRTNQYVDQLLYESNGKSTWIHVSIANNGKLPRHNIIDNYKVK